MATIAERMKQAMDESGITQAELAARTGIGKSSISTYLKGTYDPKQKNIYKIAKVLGVSEAWLMGEEVPKKRVDPLKEEDYAGFLSLSRIPILGRIAAGQPIYAVENIEGYTYTDLNGGAEYFGLRVSGDSMDAARINDGDTVIVRRQDTADDGQIAVVLIDNEEATLKRFHQSGSMVTLMPQSTNPVHGPLVYDARKTRISILGIVVRVEFTPN